MFMDHNSTHLIKISKFRLLFACAFFNLTLMPASYEFRVANCSTVNFKGLVRGKDGGFDGDQETIAEIWHSDKYKPEAEFLQSREALPSQGLRIKHKARRALEQGRTADGHCFVCHEIIWHTLLKDLAKPDIKVTAKKELISYPHDVRPHSLTSIGPKAETVALLISDISRLTPFLSSAMKPDTDSQRMWDEVEELSRVAGK